MSWVGLWWRVGFETRLEVRNEAREVVRARLATGWPAGCLDDCLDVNDRFISAGAG